MTNVKNSKKDVMSAASWMTWINKNHSTYLDVSAEFQDELIGVRVPEKRLRSEKGYIITDLESWYEPTKGTGLLQRYSMEEKEALRRRIFRKKLRGPQQHQFLIRGFLATVPAELSFLEDAIEESTYILDLQKGWDGEDADPFKHETWQKAVTLLIDYYKYIFAQTDSVLPAPEILNSSKGSIDLLWRNEDTQLLINIPEGDESVTFFGFNSNDESVKGKFKFPNPKFPMALAIFNLF